MRENFYKKDLTSRKSFQIIDNQLATTSFSVTNKFGNPIIVGATILVLAERFNFQFHYQKMKPNLNLDSDSFIFA